MAWPDPPRRAVRPPATRCSWWAAPAAGSSGPAGPPRPAPRSWPTGGARSGNGPRRRLVDAAVRVWRAIAASSVTAGFDRALAEGLARPPRNPAHQSHGEETHDRHPGPARRRGREPAQPHVQGRSRRRTCTLPGPRLHRPRAPPDRPVAAGAAQPPARSSTTAASAAPATCRSCRSTRASSTRPRRRSRRTRRTSTRRTSSSSPSRAAATRVASTFGVLGAVRAAVRAPDPVHRQAQPQRAAHLPEQVRPDHVRLASSRRSTWAPPASAPRSTSARTSRRRQIQEVTRGVRARPTSSACSRCCGATCATTRSRRTASTTTCAADLTGQANHLGVTIEADIIKQKLPENNGGFTRSTTARPRPLVYDELTTDHPIDLTR